MKKRILSVLLCLCMVMALLPTTALATGSEINDVNSLRTALQTGGTYTLTDNVTCDSGDNLELTAGKTLTITGDGQYTITMGSTYQLMIPSTSTMTLKNLTIKGGARSIENKGTLTMEKVTLTGANMSSNGNGAGLYNDAGATAILTNCNIRGNACPGNFIGGGSGGGFYNAGTLIMENCAIVENTSNKNGGGGINYGTLYMNNCTVANNESGDQGGGIYHYGDDAKTYLMNATVTGNITTYYGGGIYNSGGSLYAVNSVFAFNYANSIIKDIYCTSESSFFYSCAYGSQSGYATFTDSKSLTTANTQESVTALFNAADSESSTYARPAVTSFTKDGFTSCGVYLKDGSALLTGGTATYYDRTDSTVKMSYGSAETALGSLGAASTAVTTYQDGTTGRTGSVIGALPTPPPHEHRNCGLSDCDASHGHSETLTWTKLTNANLSTYVTSNQLAPGNYYLGEDIALDTYLTLNQTDSITNICLNGHKITSTYSNYIFTVDNSTAVLNICDCAGGGQITGAGAVKVEGGTLNLYGGSITGNTTAQLGGGVWVNTAGTFNMYGGSITGNTVNYGKGGGVYVSGTFNMHGGTISNNKVTSSDNAEGGGGVYLYAAGAAFNMYGGEIFENRALNGGGVLLYRGTFTMTGGTIRNNTATSNGGGVYIRSGTFNVYGSPEITGNTLNGTPENNVRCLTNEQINITGSLNSGAQIGVNKASAGTITHGWDTHMSTVEDEDIDEYFTPDDSAVYGIRKNASGELELYVMHDHGNWTYSYASGTLTATCGNSNCTLSGSKVSLAVNVSTTTQYKSSGYSCPVTVATTSAWTSAGLATPTITDNGLSADSLNGTATITVGGAAVTNGTVAYTLIKGTLSASDFNYTAPSNLTYDGTQKTAAVTPKIGVEHVGLMTVNYYKGETRLDSNPKDVGTYTVKISINDNTYYNEVSNLTDSWTFTISKGTQAITVPNDKTIIKNGVAVDISGWASVAGAAGGTDPGALSYALNGTYDGVTLVDNQLKVEPSATASPISIKVTAAATDNYEEATNTFNVTVNAKSQEPLTVEQAGWTYGQTKVDPSYTKPEGTIDSTIKVTYAVRGSDTFAETVPTNAGDYTVKVVLETAEKIYTGTADFTISPATMSGITATPYSGIYDGNFHGITVNVPAEYAGATVSYSTDGTNYTFNNQFTNFTNGEQTVYYKVSKDNYNDFTDSATVNITKATMSGITATPYSGIYDDDFHGITLNNVPSGADVKYGTSAENCNFISSALYKDAGTHTVYYKITKANYEDFTGSATVTIAKKDITGATVGSFDPMAYNGSAQTPRATVTIDSLTATGTWSDVTNVGDTTIFTASGNFTGTISGQDPGMAKKIVDALALNNVVTAPSKNGTPQTSITDQAQYIGTISWAPADASFLGGKVYIATLTLAATGNYTFIGVAANSFTYPGATTVANAADSGAVTITFPATSNAVVSSIAIKTPAAKTTYLVGESLSVDGLVITATMDDSTTVDVPVTTGMVSGFDSSVYAQSQTLTITYDGKTTTYNITVNKLDQSAPDAPTMASKDSGSVTLNAITTPGQGAVEYAKNTANTAPADGWQTDRTFTGLDPDTTYYFFARYAGSDTHNPAVSAFAEIKTDPAPVIPVVPTYTVTMADSADGSVALSTTGATHGSIVTVTVTPDRYYKVDGVVVKDRNGNEIAVTDNKDGTFTFQMPASKVTVEAIFSWDNPFTDVDENAYYAPAVEWALKNSITNGTGDGTTFSPNDGCTRAQIVTFLWQAAGRPEPVGMNSFTDVSADAYYAKAVAWAVEQGITDGTGGGKFSPDEICTRSQGVTFLYRAAGFPEVSDHIVFSDVATGSYYAGAVAWAAQNGVTNGTGNGKFSPSADCSRAQIMTFLYRWMVK